MVTEKDLSDIAGKTVRGSLYSGIAAAITFMLGFTRSILLARLLLPEHFGVMALVLFFIGLYYVLWYFGLDEAIIHHQDEDDGLKSTYFSLRMSLDGLRTATLLVSAPILQYLYPQMPQLQHILIVFSFISLMASVNTVQITFMRKELAFASLAIADIVSSLVMTIVAPIGAWLGWGVWALVAEGASDTLIRFIFVWGIFRRWRPHFSWDRQHLKRFRQFGKPIWVKTNIDYFLDRFDDFWIGSVLGQHSLGYYAKAYDFARAPRRVFATPILKVFVPVFARLQHDRERLSQAFFHCAYVLIRTVFFGGGLFALIMPEFISLVIGGKWLPMLWTFRLLLLYVVCDSFLLLAKGVFVAIGKPEILRNATLIQAAFFIPSVIFGAHVSGINGVALAADGMLLVGFWLLYRPLTKTIDFSLQRIVGWPAFAITAAFLAGILFETHIAATLWQSLFVKIIGFSIIFGGVLVAREWEDYAREGKAVLALLKHRSTE